MEKKHFAEAITHWSRMTPHPRDAALKNGSRLEGERENTHAKQHQDKAWATKAQQDLPINVAIVGGP
jgi:hypothetical protein